MGFELDGEGGYEVFFEKDKTAMKKIVAKKSLRVTSEKRFRGKVVSQSINLKKAFITGKDVADAFVKCETILRKHIGKDTDHVFFEGFVSARAGDKEVKCSRWSS